MKKILIITSEMPSILVTFITLTIVGITFQYSVTASWKPWAFGHAIRFLIFLPLIFTIGSLRIRQIYNNSYIVFIISILALLIVQFFGHSGMGAKRWINLYFLKLQPSELAKVSFVLFLSRYYSSRNDKEITKLITHIKAFLITFPVILLIAKQPDLGTALLLFFLVCFFIAICGIRLRYIILSVAFLVVSPLFIWNNLHNYQKQRVISFLNPESDPRGNGYHIIQSKIAIGSGGLKGKGFLKGSQSKLNFLPEKHTDFIFTSICEETGFVGALSIIFSFMLMIVGITRLAYSSTHKFGLLLALGIGFLIFEHAIINMCMVSGLIPIVGVPLPFVSYGGSSLLAFSLLIGILANIALNRTARI